MSTVTKLLRGESRADSKQNHLIEIAGGAGARHDRAPSAAGAGKEHLIEIHPDNATSKDWVILLEAATIVGSSPKRLRVARTMRAPAIVKKYGVLRGAKHFLFVEGYDPRIHAVYFCPQLYKDGPDHKLVPLEGEEIGELIAAALEGGIKERRPWYEPSEQLPSEPVISAPMLTEFDTLVAETPGRAKRA